MSHFTKYKTINHITPQGVLLCATHTKVLAAQANGFYLPVWQDPLELPTRNCHSLTRQFLRFAHILRRGWLIVKYKAKRFLLFFAALYLPFLILLIIHMNDLSDLGLVTFMPAWPICYIAKSSSCLFYLSNFCSSAMAFGLGYSSFYKESKYFIKLLLITLLYSLSSMIFGFFTIIY